jgi:hypothetical protein
MELEGVVQNGVIVPQGECPLPEGTKVRYAPTEGPVPQGPPRATVWDRMRQFARESEQEPCDLPADYAINHDHYLHGAPKRR